MNEKASRSYDEWVIESLKGDEKVKIKLFSLT
jgi:hypothetical protein